MEKEPIRHYLQKTLQCEDDQEDILQALLQKDIYKPGNDIS